MSLQLQLFLIGFVNNLNIVLVLLLIMFLFFILVKLHQYIEYYNTTEEEKLLAINNIKKYVILWFIMLFTLTFIPNEKTMYLMVGASLSKDLLDSDTGQKVHQILINNLDYILQNKQTNK